MNWEGLILDEETGRFTLRFAGGECRDLYAQVKLQDGTCLKTTDMKLHKKRETEVTTEIGSCPGHNPVQISCSTGAAPHALLLFAV